MVVPTRRELIKAFFGQTKIVVPLAREIGGTGGEATTQFFTDGKFLKIWKDKPRFTRTSAVVCLTERFTEHTSDVLPQNVFVDHRWLVLHNPHSEHPVSEAVWGECPQFIRDGQVMRWTDGKPIEYE